MKYTNKYEINSRVDTEYNKYNEVLFYAVDILSNDSAGNVRYFEGSSTMLKLKRDFERYLPRSWIQQQQNGC